MGSREFHGFHEQPDLRGPILSQVGLIDVVGKPHARRVAVREPTLAHRDQTVVQFTNIHIASRQMELRTGLGAIRIIRAIRGSPRHPEELKFAICGVNP